MTPGTTDLLFRIAATLGVLITAGSPFAIALLTHWRRKPDATSPAAAPSPSVTDAAALQGMAIAMLAPLRAEVADLTAQRDTAERHTAAARAELLQETTRRQVAEAERDLAVGALRARDLPVPTLVHPSHREDPHG